MQQLTPSQPVLLVELLDFGTEDLLECDVTLHLQNALEAVYVHLADYSQAVTPKVSLASNGELKGIGFFGPNEEYLAFISAYYLEREAASCEFEPLRNLCAQPLSNLDAGLKELFR